MKQSFARTISLGEHEEGIDNVVQEFEGVYLGTRVIDVNGKSMVIHDFKDQKSNEKFCCWSCAALSGQLGNVPPNTLVRATYLGKKTNPKTGRTFNDVEVMADMPDDQQLPF